MFTLIANALHLPRPKNGVMIPMSSSSSDHLDMEYPYLSASGEGVEPSFLGSEPGVLPLYEPELLLKSTILHQSGIQNYINSLIVAYMTHILNHQIRIYSFYD